MSRFPMCCAILCLAGTASAFDARSLASMLEEHDPVVLLQTNAGLLGGAWREDGKRDMMMTAHHKTGMVLALKAAQCINETSVEVSAFKRAARFWETGPPKGMAMIHFTRDLHDLTVSAYMYHRFSSQEPMHIRRGTASQIKSIVQRQAKASESEMNWYETDKRESFQHWLKRVPNDIGLRAQMGQLIPQLEQMKDLSVFCKGHPGECIEVDLSAFTASTTSFNAAWRSIFKFVGVDIDQHNDLKECLAQLDESSPIFKPEAEGPRMTHHVTSTRLTAEEHKDMVNIIQKLDHQFYHDMLSTAMS